MAIQSSEQVEKLTQRLALEHLIGREPSTIDRVRSVLADELGHDFTGLHLVEKVIQGDTSASLPAGVAPLVENVAIPVGRPAERPHAHEAFVQQTADEIAKRKGVYTEPVAQADGNAEELGADPTASSESGDSPIGSSTAGQEPSDADPSGANSASTSSEPPATDVPAQGSTRDATSSDGSSPSSTTEEPSEPGPISEASVAETAGTLLEGTSAAKISDESLPNSEVTTASISESSAPSAADLDAVAQEQKAADDTAAKEGNDAA